MLAAIIAVLGRAEARVPLPRVSLPPAGSASAARRVLFVSYSHADMAEYGATFIKYLSLKLRGRPDLAFAEGDIFFDQNRLKAGQFWDETIQTALEEAGALILLVSHNSLMSRYCMEREVGTAMQRGIPVIPVVLQACPWEEQPLPGDPLGRQLGAIGALPKSASFALLPISDWADRASAWDATVDQIADALQAATTAPAVTPTRARTAPVPALLPYFCDQHRAESGFNRGMMDWSAAALLVLVKGLIDDRPPRFWDRLREKNLSGYATARRQLPLLEQRALTWPSAWDGARVRSEAALDADILCQLSDAITGNPFAIATTAALADRLDRLNGVLPLLASLPDEPVKALAAGFQALGRALASCPPQAPLDRLVIACVVEDDALLAAPSLLKALKLTALPRARVIELDRLQALTRDEVRIWHRNQEVQRYCALDEDGLVAAVFETTESLRFSQFEARLKPLLGT